MEKYKKDFIQFLLDKRALLMSESPDNDFTLNSGRKSPWFIDFGYFNDGASISRLGHYYAQALLHFSAETDKKFDILYGIPEKGIALAVATAIEMNNLGANIPWFFTRKFPKEYGESSNLTPAEKIKAFVVGSEPEESRAIAQIDDVFSAGDAKYGAQRTLRSMGNFKLPVLAIAVDRQEVDTKGKNAIEEYETSTGTKVISIVNASEIYTSLYDYQPFLKKKLERIADYLMSHGTDEARKAL